jgi:hypothetical protein
VQLSISPDAAYTDTMVASKATNTKKTLITVDGAQQVSSTRNRYQNLFVRSRYLWVTTALLKATPPQVLLHSDLSTFKEFLKFV